MVQWSQAVVGIDIIILIVVFGTCAASVNHVFALGSNIKAVIEWLLRKTPSEAERRFKEIGPLASLVQGRLANRVLSIALVTIAGVAVVVLGSGEFSIQEFGLGELLDIGVGSLGTLLGGTMYRQGLIRRLLTPDEVGILEEFDRAYLAYIREKRRGLGILTNIEQTILSQLGTEKGSALTPEETQKSVVESNPKHQLTVSETLEALKWLRKVRYVNAVGKRFYRSEDGTLQLSPLSDQGSKENLQL